MDIFLVALAGLTVLILAAVFSRRTGIAAPLLLLLLGLAAGVSPIVPDLALDPDVIIAGVLPPLLYTSAVRMSVVDLRRNAGFIAWLSVVMVVVTAVVIGAVVHLVFPEIPFPLAVALGAVVSPTDAVAATSIGKRLGLPFRLTSILEGESLFNDAAALVTLTTAVAAMRSSFSFPQAAATFLWASVGGVAVGVAVGWASVAVRARLGDPVLTTSVSFAVPWVAFFPAEEIHASGIIAVVVAGVVSGHRGRTRLSALERTTEATTWASIDFVLENAVFLVMGLEIMTLVRDSRIGDRVDRFGELCALVFALMVVLRFVGIAIPVLWQRLRPDSRVRLRDRLSGRAERLRELEEQDRIDAERAEAWQRRLDRRRADLDFSLNQPITRRGGIVLAWAGMRGVVTLAAAQTIDVDIGGHPTPYRSTIVLVAFVVAVVSLVVFGGTLPWVIRRLGFETPSATDRRDELTSLLGDLGDDVVTSLGPLTAQQIDGEKVSPEVIETVKQRFTPFFLAHDADDPGHGTREDAIRLQRRYLDEFRAALAREQSIGAYSTETLRQAQRLLDREETRLDAAR